MLNSISVQFKGAMRVSQPHNHTIVAVPVSSGRVL